jgi:GntR family transcriptional regulator of arabinose operon
MNKAYLSGLSKAPRYRQVMDALLRDLESGKYPAGQKLPSEAVLMQRFGTSRITVGRALRELKHGGRITGIAGSGNFVRESSAGLLFGLLIPNLGEGDIFESICRGMASAPEAGSHALLWGHTTGPETGIEEQALQLCEQYIARKVAGVFFVPIELTSRKDEVNAQICAMLTAARIPVVLLDRCIAKFHERSQFDVVGIDNRRAGYLATECLLKVGCRDVAFLGLAGAAPTVRARLAGYREALFEFGVPYDASRVQLIADQSLRQAFEAARSTAFVCATDRLAGPLMQTVQALGLRVPQDIRVVGIDDVDYARLLPVPLTTVHQPCREIGEAAIAAMLERRAKPKIPARDILLDCHLVARASHSI